MRLFSLLFIGLLQITYFAPQSWAETGAAIDTSQDADQDQLATSDANNAPGAQTAISSKHNPYLNFNPHSVKPIPEPNIMFRRRVWREIYLKERQNKPFFARDKEITKLIIEGVKSGVLTPYSSDSLTVEMSIDQFFENLSLPKDDGLSADEKVLGFTDDAGWDSKKTPISVVEEKDYFLPHEVTTLEIMEDVIFDKVSSRLIYDIQSIKLIIPADKFATGLRRLVATFRYKDLAAYFDSRPKEALWINTKNSAGNIKLTEAFELRKFGSRIVKIENPDDANVDDIYNKTPKSGLMASQQLEEELIELEHFLWEN